MSRRVLLVEDDPLSLKLMADSLQARGIATTGVTNGGAVLSAAQEQDVALVVMDIGLPGTDGVEATRQLKSTPATAHLPVVAVTAYAMQADRERMRSAGCDVILTKPLRFADFVTVVEELLG